MNKKEKGLERLMNALGGDEDKIRSMQKTAFKLGILIAIRNSNNSTDKKVIAKQLFDDKEGIQTLEFMEEIVEEFYDELVEEGSLDSDGQLTPGAVVVALQYQSLMQGPLEKPSPELNFMKGSTFITTDGASMPELRINKGDKGVMVSDITVETPEGTVIAVIWDKDPAKKVRTWLMEFAQVYGYKDVEGDHDENMLQQRAIVEKLVSAQEEINKVLTPEDDELMDKFMAERAGVYKLTLAERRKVEVLQGKIQGMMEG